MQTDTSRGYFAEILVNHQPAIVELAHQLRELIGELCPDAFEQPRPAEQHVCYTFAPQRQEAAFAYLCPLAGYVRLGFYYGGALPDPSRLLVGTGKRLRHVKLYRPAEAAQPAVRQLIATAVWERRAALGLPQTAPAQIVNGWLEAANRHDVERLLALSDPQIEVVGPRGAGYGHQLLRDWLGRAGLQLTTQRQFGRANVVVAAQHGVWRSAESGEVIGEAEVASLFRVDHQRVLHFARYDQALDALAAAGLTEADELG